MDTVDSSTPGGPSRELWIPREKPLITPDTLYGDNRSPESHDRITSWDIYRLGGEHILTAGCGDAREEIPMDTQAEIIQSLGTGGPKDPYQSLLSGRNLRAGVNLTHHNGDTVKEGVAPSGCGILDMKVQIEKNGKKGNPTEEFAEDDIKHGDIIVQTCASAYAISARTDIPILGATEDHLTGEIHPLFASWTHRDTRYSITNRSITLEDILDPIKYNPKKIYQDGLPCINVNDLPDVFQEYLAANRKEMQLLHEKYPDYRQIQQVQNPHTIFITTDIRPVRLKYPTIFDAPGSFFRLTIPRIKNSKGEDFGRIEFSKEELERVFRQAWFPVTEFSNATNIIIETPDFGWSAAIGNNLAREKWMQNWIRKDDAQIIALEARGGMIYNPTKIDLAA